MVCSLPVASALTPPWTPTPEDEAVKRTLATIATVIVGAAGLTACSDEQAYCVDLAKYAAGAVNVDPQKPADYVKILDDAKKLKDSAPDEVKDDWAVVATFAEKAEKAGSDRVELAKLSKETGAVMTAYKAITTHAKDSCKVDVPALN
jgi:predicted component of type VI protein secretion system